MFFVAASGFVRGFTNNFLSTCAWYGSGFIAILVAPYLIPAISRNIPNLTLARVAAVSIAYLTILVVLLLVVSVISQKVKKGVLSGIDRAVGVLFGLFKSAGILICLHILMLVFEVKKDKYPLLKNSKLSAVIFSIAKSLMPRISKIKLIESIQRTRLPEKGISVEKPLPEVKKKKPPEKVPVVAEIIRKKENTEEEAEKPKDKEKTNMLNKLKELIINLIVRREVGLEPEVTKPQQAQQPETENQRSADRPKYGSMSLMEARIKRRKERKAAKLKKALQKQLDNEGL
jgi:membrane protein required for colicin V production